MELKIKFGKGRGRGKARWCSAFGRGFASVGRGVGEKRYFY